MAKLLVYVLWLKFYEARRSGNWHFTSGRGREEELEEGHVNAGPSECSRHSPCCSLKIMQCLENHFLVSFSLASSMRDQSRNFANFLAPQKSSSRASIVPWVMKTSPMTSSRLSFSRFHFCCLRDWLHKVQKRTAGSLQDNDPNFSIPNPAYVLIDFSHFRSHSASSEKRKIHSQFSHHFRRNSIGLFFSRCSSGFTRGRLDGRDVNRGGRKLCKCNDTTEMTAGRASAQFLGLFSTCAAGPYNININILSGE